MGKIGYEYFNFLSSKYIYLFKMIIFLSFFNYFVELIQLNIFFDFVQNDSFSTFLLLTMHT